MQQRILQQLYQRPYQTPFSQHFPYPPLPPPIPPPIQLPIPPPTTPFPVQSPPTSQPGPSTPNRPQKSQTSGSSPLPLTKLQGNALPSSAIDTSKLVSIESVIEQYPKLKTESKAGTLACKIAKQALFGASVMKQCTPIGNRELPGLPVKQLKQLKKAMFTQFPQYWKAPVEFETVWKKCLESVQQGCKRLRLGKDKEKEV